MRKAMLLSMVVGVGLGVSRDAAARSGDDVVVEKSPVRLESSADWPVLKYYDPDHLARLAMPLGGIGTGTVSLGGRGDCATGRS